jgi:exodeoxyribonuclease VII large subunit
MDSLAQLLTSDEPRRLTVSDLTAHIRRRLEGDFASVAVEGEISNFKAHSSGHWYFTLKDARAQLRVSCFRNANLRIRFRPADGLSVVARGKISVYEPRGDYQLIAESLEPVGAGALQLAFEKLKARLHAEGLFDAGRKRPIPVFPKRIGIVTSPTGAALRDILEVLRRRNHTASVLLHPAGVEGASAAAEITAGIRHLSEHYGPGAADPIDVMIIGRGGGAAESLQAFQDEGVARAIFASRIPVISAVGHEIDFTIADFVADLRAPTPSAAAELVSAKRVELLERIAALDASLSAILRHRLLDARARVLELSRHQVFEDARVRLRDAQQHTDEMVFRLESAMAERLRALHERRRDAAHFLTGYDWTPRFQVRRHQLAQTESAVTRALHDAVSNRRHRLARLAASLDALSPMRTLARGYAVAQTGDGAPVRTVQDARPGDEITLRVAEAEFHCVVSEAFVREPL